MISIVTIVIMILFLFVNPLFYGQNKHFFEDYANLVYGTYQ